MQSTTPTSTSTHELQSCFVQIGAEMLAKDPTAFNNLYQPVYNWFLQSMHGTTVTPPSQPTTRPRGRRAAQPVAPVAQAATRPRTRTPPGTLGTQDARILAAINATPGIAVDPLRRKFRGVQPHLVGTSVSRLLKAGYISGVPKIGPWAITTAGVEVLKKQPASINTERRRRTAARPTPAAGEAAQMAQTG